MVLSKLIKDENLKIPLVSSLIFLLFSPAGQWFLGLLGGLLIYSFSVIFKVEMSEIDVPFMLFVGMCGIIWFAFSTSKCIKWLSSFIVLFGISNAIWFYSYGNTVEYFYPDRYVLGSFISAILLLTVGFFKKRR